MDVHNSILNKLTEEYIAISGVEGIFWGGSSCGCSPEPYSDIDIFIVTDNTVQRRHVLRKVTNKCKSIYRCYMFCTRERDKNNLGYSPIV